jgi:hypothetical protein
MTSIIFSTFGVLHQFFVDRSEIRMPIGVKHLTGMAHAATIGKWRIVADGLPVFAQQHLCPSPCRGKFAYTVITGKNKRMCHAPGGKSPLQRINRFVLTKYFFQ